MLTSVTIRGFRSFQSLHVKPLSRVNLFVGANNAGKTSLLEAIELLVQGTPTALWRSPARRGEEIIQGPDEDRPTWAEFDLSHLFFGHSLKNATFSIEGEGTPPRSVECQVLEPRFDVEGGAGQGRLPLDESAGPILPISFRSSALSSPEVIPVTPGGGVTQSTRRRYLSFPQESITPVNFIAPESIDSRRLGSLWDRVVLTPEEQTVIEALRLIEPRIARIAFLRDERRARNSIVLLLADSEQRLPLGSVGDGLKRLLALVLHILPTRGGFVFVDEIDTGLHYSVMADMWRLVINTAKRLNVQVFATTHSSDCIHALGFICDKHAELRSEIAVHRVEKERTESVSYTLEELILAARNRIEIR